MFSFFSTPYPPKAVVLVFNGKVSITWNTSVLVNQKNKTVILVLNLNSPIGLVLSKRKNKKRTNLWKILI